MHLDAPALPIGGHIGDGGRHGADDALRGELLLERGFRPTGRPGCQSFVEFGPQAPLFLRG